MPQFDYEKVSSLKEAFEAASTSRGESVFMAGGTDLLVQIKEGKRRPRGVIDLKDIPEMRGLSLSENALVIGALTTIRTLETSSMPDGGLLLLAQSAAKLGSVQVRNRATVGGNLCNASPSADMAPALLALDAQAEIFGKTGLRTMALDTFFAGPRTTVLGAGEILTSFKIPRSAEHQGGCYLKLSTRNAMDLAVVNLAVLLSVNADGTISKARMALGAVAPTPLRVPAVEKLLAGSRLETGVLREASEAAAHACRPISDIRASARYRTEMVKKLCRRGLLLAYRRAISTGEIGDQR
ncbi:MAG: xanthine dehydrogenase family protein subunit M [Desulfobacterales bacterium]|nr:xanthine dehydrogenase family protein subunit M [Desulfobacterales bacterium]